MPAGTRTRLGFAVAFLAVPLLVFGGFGHLGAAADDVTAITIVSGLVLGLAVLLTPSVRRYGAGLLLGTLLVLLVLARFAFSE